MACSSGWSAAFLAAAIPPLAAQATALAHQLPHYLHTLQDHNSQLGKLNVRYHIQQRLTKLLTTKGGSLVGGVLGPGSWCSARPRLFSIVAVLASTSWPACPGSSCSPTGSRRTRGGPG